MMATVRSFDPFADFMPHMAKVSIVPEREIDTEECNKLGLFEPMMRQRVRVVGLKLVAFRKWANESFTGFWIQWERERYPRDEFVIGVEVEADFVLVKLKWAGAVA